MRIYFNSTIRTAIASWGLMIQEILILNGSIAKFGAESTSPCDSSDVQYIPHTPLVG